MTGVLALLAGCARVGDTDAVVVAFSVDTLGLTMANQTGWCSRVGEIVGDYGLDLACLDAAIAPSSWTAESHTRMLWPQQSTGDRRRDESPQCNTPSALETIRDSTGGVYLWGADNSVLSENEHNGCDWFRSGFTQGSDEVWETGLDSVKMPSVEEADRPVSLAIDAFERWLPYHDKSVTLFLNSVEPGGHEPRCWQDPSTEACEALWQVAVDARIVEADADREETWLDRDFYERLLHYTTVNHADDLDRWRPLYWQTATETVEAFRAEKFDDRLRRVLAALAAEDRLDDLRLVVFGDHGENPCVARGLGDDTLNCGPNGLTTEFTGFVPVYVSPAALGERWTDLGLVGSPWSAMNIAHGLLDSVDVPRPGDWPAPWPAGTAISWTCQGPDDGVVTGVAVDGETSIRCRGGNCAASSFTVPADEKHLPTSLAEIPASLAPYGEVPDWFSVACGVD